MPVPCSEISIRVWYYETVPTRYLVRDIEESLTFYALLDFEVVERWGPAFAIVSDGSNTLWLSGPQTSAAKPMPNGEKPASGGWNRIVITRESFDSTVAKLKELGSTFRNEPIVGPGGRQVLFEDPSGNPVELFESGTR